MPSKKLKPLLEEEAFVMLQKAADVYMQTIGAVLREFQLSPTQYNVLRILRGAGDAGLPCGEIAARMINRDPDITRLLDRLAGRGLVKRARQDQDRRVVQAWITDEGLNLVNAMDEPVRNTHRSRFGKLERSKLQQLVALLREAIASAEADSSPQGGANRR